MPEEENLKDFSQMSPIISNKCFVVCVVLVVSQLVRLSVFKHGDLARISLT